MFKLTWKNKLHRMGKSVSQSVDKHAPLKSKVIRGNNKPFVTKTLRKAIMWRSALKEKAT